MRKRGGRKREREQEGKRERERGREREREREREYKTNPNCVLGLSWVFAFLAVEDARVVFQYLFTITTSLQGLLIFLVFTARDPVVRTFWRQVFCCGKYKEDKSSSYNQNHPNQARAKGQDKVGLFVCL